MAQRYQDSCRLGRSPAASLRVRGYTDQHEQRWVGVRSQGRRGYIRLDQLHDTRNAWAASLTRQGITVTTSTTRALILREAERTSFGRSLLAVDRHGWVGRRYFLRGSVIPPRLGGIPAVDARMGLDATPDLPGCFADWADGVRQLVAGQELPIFALCCAFAGLLLPHTPGIVDNPGFEFCGPSSTGKSTLLRLAASVLGGPERVGKWLTTSNALEDATARCGGVLLLDEAGLFLSAGDHGRAREYHGALMRLADGSAKRRLGDVAPLQHRFVFLSSTNTAVADHLGGFSPDEVAAVAVRVVTIRADAEAGLGVFSRLPPGVPDGADAAGRMTALAAQNHGWAGRPFVRFLEAQLAAPGRRAALLQAIERDMASFRRRACSSDEPSGPEARVLEKFALVAAAGRLAQRCGTLPVKGIERAVLAVYTRCSHNCAVAAPPRSAQDRVAAYVRQHRKVLYDLRDGQYPALTDEQLDESPGFLMHKDHTPWLLIRRARWQQAFGSLATTMLRELEKEGALWAREGRQAQVRVRASTDKERVYRIRLHKLPAETS